MDQMREKINEKLFRMLFPNEYITMTLLINSEKKLNKTIQKKEAEIQTLRRKIRRLEIEKKK